MQEDFEIEKDTVCMLELTQTNNSNNMDKNDNSFFFILLSALECKLSCMLA